MEVEDPSNIGKNPRVHQFNCLFGMAREEFVFGVSTLSILTFVVKLMHIKVMNLWTNKSFDILLQFLKDTFLNVLKIRSSTYEVKKILCDLGLGYESIHACKYNCCLFWNDLEEAENMS